jgi:ABC-type nitrate/sulfonate/bicarbonate transport system substrate-binding protein
MVLGSTGALAITPRRHLYPAETDEVVIGSPATISGAPFFIAERKGYWAEQNLHLKIVNMQTGPQMVAPPGASLIDIAAAATSAGLFNAAARSIGLKMVADKGSNQPGYSYGSPLVRKALVDSGKFKTMKDLKGLKIAEPGKGGSTGSTVNQALKSAGLTYDDVTHVHPRLSRDADRHGERRDRRSHRAGAVQHLRPQQGDRHALSKRYILSAPDQSPSFSTARLSWLSAPKSPSASWWPI